MSPSRKTVSAAHQNIPYRVRVLSQLLARRLQNRLEPYGLTPAHFTVLNCLWKQDGLAISEIGEKLFQVGGTMTGVIDRMEERELIYRERDHDDRRVWRAYLTTKGKQLAKTLPQLMAKSRENLLESISEQELTVFKDVLEQMIANASAELYEAKS